MTVSKWKQLPLKRVAAINPEVLPEDTDPDFAIVYVDIGGVSLEAGIRDTETLRFGNAPSRARRLVRAGDTIVSTVRTYLRAIAPIVNPPNNMVVSTGFAVVRSTGVVDSNFLSWALRSSQFVEAVVAESVGVSYPAIAPTSLGSIPVPVPPMAGQQAIAAFLDRETAKIDALIAKQTEFLMRLDEHRRALVINAITHGLDPAAPAQVTGVATFPLIPAHWTLRPLMHLVVPTRPINYGVLMPGPRIAEGVPLIEAGDVMAGPIQPKELRRTTPGIEAPFARSRLNAGDIVVAIRGSIGAAQIVPETLTNANVTRDAARVSPRISVNSQYLTYVLGSDALRDHYASQSLGAAVQGINISDLKRAPIPLPPVGEQTTIADYLDVELKRIEQVRFASQKMIDRLRERRSALITAAVTGQIDVTEPALTEAAA